MPIRAVCPECGATTSIDDPTPATTLTCHQCGGTVPVPTAKAGPPPVRRPGPPPLPVPTKVSAPAADGGFEVLDDSAVAVAEPPRSRKPAKAAPPPEDEEYEVLQDVGDDEPEEDAEAVAVEADDEDDEVEMDVGVPRMRAFVGDFEPGSRPLPRRKGQKSSGSPLLLIGGVLAALLLVGGGAAGVYFLWPEKSGTTDVASNDPPQDAGVRPGPEVKSAPEVKKDPVVKTPPAVPPIPAQTLSLPGKVTDVCVSGSTARVFAHCAAEKKLVILDLTTGKTVLDLPTTGPDTVFAAGGGKLLVVNPVTRVIQRWDLDKLAPDLTAPVPFPGTVKAISLGELSDGPALVVTDNPDEVWPVHLLHVDTLTPAAEAWATPLPPDLPRDVRVRASADGTAWALVAKGGGKGPGVGVKLEGNRLVLTPPYQFPGWFAVPSADGIYLYHDEGRVRWGANQSDPFSPPQTWRIGVAPTTLEMTVRPDGDRSRLSVFHSFFTDPIFADADIPRPAGPESGLTPDQLVAYLPTRGAAVVIPPSLDRIEVVSAPVAADAVAKMPRPTPAFLTVPPRSFTPGTTYRYRPAVTAKGKVHFQVVGQPPGWSVTPDGVIEWKVPTNFQPDRIQVHIAGLVDPDLSVADQHVLLYSLGTAPPKALQPKKTIDPKKSPDPKKDPVVSAPPPDPIAQGAKLVNPLPDRIPITPTALTDPLPVPLGGPVRDVCVGGGGRYLIAHVPTARRLVIFDVSAASIVGSIGLGADHVLFAAGMSKLLVVYPEEKQVLRYSLPTGKLETDAELDVRPKPVAAAMGSATAGPLVLGGPVTQNNASKLALTFIDVETLKEVRIDKAEGDLRIGFGAAANLRVSADGQTVAMWYKQLQPSGLQLVRLAGNTLTGVHKAIGVGHVVPAPAGPDVFTEKGTHDPKGEPVGRREISLPATHGTDFLTITDAAGGAKSVAIWRGGDKPVKEFTTLTGFDGKKDPFERDNPTLALDKRLFLIPDANLLVVVPPAGDRFVLYPLTPAKK